MNLANTIKAMYEKRNDPPFDTKEKDYASAAKKLRAYAQKNGGVDKNDMMRIANELDALAKNPNPRLLARTMKNIQSLDTDVREVILGMMKESNCMESYEEGLQIDEAMVRGKEVFDKTFANRTQADAFAKKNGGRVRQIGRVFYVFKEDVNEAKEDEEPASPDEGKMAKKQLEFIEYAAEEIADHIESGKEFPEWMQNKLSELHGKMKDLHSALGEHGGDDEKEMEEKKKVKKEDIDFDSVFEEVIGLEEARNPNKSGGTGYDLYHKDFSSAMQHAYKYAKDKLGIEIDPKEIDDKVASGPRKPSKGKTNSYRLKGKDGKKGVQIQVANLDDKKFELNMYKESVELEELKKYDKNADYRLLNRLSQKAKTGNLTPAEKSQMANAKSRLRNHGFSEDVELDENKNLIKDYQDMKATGKKDHNILDVLMSMPKYKRMSKDQMAKIIGDAKRKGIFKEEVELDEAYKTPAEASAYEAGKKAARSGKKYDDNPNKKGTAEFTAWSKGHNEARAKGMKEEVELDEAFMKWQVKVGAKVWRGTARNAGEAVKKARPSMGNLDLSKASVTRIDEEKVEENTMTLEEAVMQAVFGEAKKVKKEDNTNDKSDDGEGMDKVQPKALKKKFDDRKDKDIDNDGDTDDSDEYLHKRRQTVSKAIEKDKKKPSGKQEPVDTAPSLDEEGEPMSDAEKAKMEKIKAKLDAKKDEFVKKYGDRAKEVIARTAIKMAKKEA